MFLADPAFTSTPHFRNEADHDRWSAQHEPMYRCECGTDMLGDERVFVEVADGEVVMCRECAAKEVA